MEDPRRKYRKEKSYSELYQHEREENRRERGERDRRESRTSERNQIRDSGERYVREKEKHRDRRSRDDVREKEKHRDRRYRDDAKEKEYHRDRRNRDDVRERAGSRKRDREERGRDKGEDRENRELEGDRKKLDAGIEKRRRRVQEWKDLKRKKEESEREKQGDACTEANQGKNWTLEGESDDEEAPSTITDVTNMDVDEDSEDVKSDPVPRNAEDEIDPLDAFMNSVVLPEVDKIRVSEKDGEKVSIKSLGRIMPGEDSDSEYEASETNEEDSTLEEDDEFMKKVKKTKSEKLSIVDHSSIDYDPFRKNLYIEVKEISRMSPEEAAAYRKELELKIHGKDVPKPVKTWHQTGLTTTILETIKKLSYEKPMPIQAQALPVIMSGRDCIGVAKTGSGKTLAFVLPLLRHIKDQPRIVSGDGPIGLIMAPTRELVQQIYSDIKKFAKALGIRCVPVYGGSGIAQQINELKRGAEIVVCTPGRMIDVLCTSGGKITNLCRVTYLVLDEADRMFDMGFEPQITRIIQNIRPDRQTVLFSATFPRQVEILARQVLNKPVEIQVGGRSVVNKDITQLVEVRPESDRFFRLLELLGEWHEKGKILVFVQTQEKCDALFKDLLRHGYPCLSLHGGKDQTDRESTVTDFKSNVWNVLIATSIAARGLDVKDLELVVNFDVPNHYEEYVHRVGRTGRAGRKGCAITFVSEEDARYAPDLVKALELSEQVVPGDLKALADSFRAKVNQGLEKARGSGYGGSGFKFSEEEDEVRKAAMKEKTREYGFEVDKSDSEDENENEVVRKVVPTVPDTPAIAITNEAAAQFQRTLAKFQAEARPEHCEAKLVINDWPENARKKVLRRTTLDEISMLTGAAITIRGKHIPPSQTSEEREDKLHLVIEGHTRHSVDATVAELKCVRDDTLNQAQRLPGGAQHGKYSVP